MTPRRGRPRAQPGLARSISPAPVRNANGKVVEGSGVRVSPSALQQVATPMPLPSWSTLARVNISKIALSAGGPHRPLSQPKL
jgi:hypothetical protein